MRARRTCLSVPASNPRFIEKARELPADEIMLDLEDAVAPLAKEEAREHAVTALTEGAWDGRTRAVRINDPTAPWAYRDVIEIVEGAGTVLDCVVLPKVTSPRHIHWLDLMLSQVEEVAGVTGRRIGIEAQIEDARGLAAVDAIAAASPRLETLVFGPADFMASINMRSLTVGGQPPGYDADAFHYPLMRILVVARAHGLQAIDGPYLQVRDLEGFTAGARRSAALGYDGKWVLHPAQIEAGNEVFAPSQEDYDRAEQILDAYEHATEVDRRGAVMLDDEMIDEASRKMALVIAAKGRASGLVRSSAPHD